MNIYLEALQTMKQQGTHIILQKESSAATLVQGIRVEIGLPEEGLLNRQALIWNHALEHCATGAEMDQLDAFINNTSIRLRLACRNTTVELPGDTYADYWDSYSLAPCTILKLPHHGHADSATPKLLQMLNPQYAVISVSNTRTDDCPSAELLQQLQARGISISFTDAVKYTAAPPQYHSSVHFDF